MSRVLLVALVSLGLLISSIQFSYGLTPPTSLFLSLKYDLTFLATIVEPFSDTVVVIRLDFPFYEGKIDAGVASAILIQASGEFSFERQQLNLDETLSYLWAFGLMKEANSPYAKVSYTAQEAFDKAW